MRRIHVTVSTDDLSQTVNDYSQRLGCEPCVVVPGEVALWRTDCVNLSVRRDATVPARPLRHLGWEDSDAKLLSTDTDPNGIVWEHFSAELHADEIEQAWPGSGYVASRN